MKRTVAFILLLVATVHGVLSTVPATALAQNADKDKKKVENPINKIINGFLGRKRGMPRGKKRAGDAGADGTEEGTKKKTFQKDGIDQRAPAIREHQSLLDSAQSRLELGQYPEAVEILQNILDQSAESVIQGEDGEYRSVRWLTHRRISLLPDQAREFYEKTYGPLAQKMLDDAYRSSDFFKIREVAERYFHTPAGYEAANRIAAYHVDRGEFAVAATWYVRLENTTARFVSDPLWKLKVGEVYRQAALNERELSSPVSISEEDRRELQRRLPGHSLEQVREQWKRYLQEYNPPLADWLFPGGSARRNGIPQGTAPLLMSDWQQGMTEHPRVRQQLSQLLEELEIDRSPIIPMMQPVTVGKRVVVRTLEGLKAIDVETGQLVWESHEKYSPAMLLAGNSSSRQDNLNGVINIQVRLARGFGGIGWLNGANSFNAGQHPLTSLLFRNGVHGTLSSDGERVFVIERNAILSRLFPGQYYNSLNLSSNDLYRRDWKSNRLTAYDLETGREVWHLGGTQMNEPIDPPLAGTFFFGPAFTDEGELFVIGEKDNALHVYCLESATGKILWSRLLAYTDAPIERDLGRRWWASQPAYAEGVLVCPTNLGLLVGIDRQSHDILWVSRYLPRKVASQSQRFQRRVNGFAMSNVGSLKDRWFATPPIIAGQTVIYAPLEEPTLLGFRLCDGEELWRNTGLQQGLYPLGTYKTDLIVVNKEDITGYDINTGEETWAVPFASFASQVDGAKQMPCGRGLIVGNQVMLPFGQREIWFFDLDKKEFTSRTHVEESRLRLGNLVMAHGKLISAGPETIAMFQPRQLVEQKIVQRLQENPQDAWALMKQAKIYALDRQYEAGLEELVKIDEKTLEGEQRRQYREQMLECLSVMCREHPDRYEEEFRQIPRYIETDSERQKFLRLYASRMIYRKDDAKAFEAYAKLANFRSRALLEDSLHLDASLSSRQDVWLHSQMKKLWDNSSGEVTSLIIRAVNEAVEQAVDSNDLQQMLHVVQVYGFHPDIEPVYFRMVELAIEQQDYATAQFALNTMARQDDESIVATSIAKRAELLYRFGLHSDAAYYMKILQEKPADLVLLDGLTVGEWLEEKEKEDWHGSIPADLSSASWRDEEFELIRIGSSSGNRLSGIVNLSESELPFYREHRFLFRSRDNRLDIIRLRDDQLIWSIPLQQTASSAATNVLPIRIDGHLLTLYYKGMVQCYSLPDQRLVWARPLSDRSANRYTIQAAGQRLPALHKASYVASRLRINSSRRKFGPLAISTSHTLCYFSKQDLVAVDPLNGEVRWIRRGVPVGTVVYGDEQYLCLLTPNSSEVKILNTTDGRSVEAGNFSSLINEAISVFNHQFIVVQKNRSSILGLAANTMKIAAIDIVSRETVWEFSIGSNDYVGQLDEKSLIVLKEQGVFQVIALSDGELLLEGDIEMVKGLREVSVFRDARQIYLVLNTSTRQTSYLNLLNQRVNGYLVAIDRQTGEQNWKYATKGLNLILQDVNQIPVLLLAARKPERVHKLTLNMFRILMIDKQSGRAVFEKALTTQQPPNRLSWSLAKKQIKMISYNAIHILRPKSEPGKPSEQ